MNNYHNYQFSYLYQKKTKNMGKLQITHMWFDPNLYKLLTCGLKLDTLPT